MVRAEAFKTMKNLNLHLFDEIWLDEKTGMPTVEACDYVPRKLLHCEYIRPLNRNTRRVVQHKCGIHFYAEDYKFESVWNNPKAYLNTLLRCDCIISPDFSTYLDMPRPMIEWQIYRNRFLAQWWQRSGANVIYNVQTLPSQFDDAQFSGIGVGGVVSMRKPLAPATNKQGMNEFFRVIDEVAQRLAPKLVLIYGKESSLPTSLNYKFFDNEKIKIQRVASERKRKVLDECTQV